MSHVIGRGRYARETYPATGQGSGPGGAIVPLTRTKFIDAGAVGAENGAAVTTPYHSIVSFLAAIGTPSSTVDADTPMYGFISPGDYSVGALAIPARRNIVLRGQGLVAAASAPIGAVTWANVDGPNPPSLSALLTIDSVVVPSVAISDDGVVESSLFLLATDGLAQCGPIDASNATRFMSLFIDGAFILTASIDVPTANIDAINGAEFTGNGAIITCLAFGTSGTGINACLFNQPLTINASAGGFFTNCFFSAAITLAGNSTFTFDGPSYASWIAAGGSLSGTTLVKVIGMPDLNRADNGTTGTPEGPAPYPAITSATLTSVASGKFRLMAWVTVSDNGGSLADADAVRTQFFKSVNGGAPAAIGPQQLTPAASVNGGGAGIAVAAPVNITYEDNSATPLGDTVAYSLDVISVNANHTSGVVAGNANIMVSELPN